MDSIKILDHGFVRLVDYMGGDDSVVQAARVSYGNGTKSKREDDALIRYLYKNKHTSPFEHVQFKFHVKAPIFIARQWMRHRTASINEISGRYSVLNEEYYVPDVSSIAMQSKDNKQGRGDLFSEEDSFDIQRAIRISQETSYKFYLSLIDKGVSREIARVVLPLGIYTEFYWTINLHNLFHFLRLRLHQHAQLEIRQYAECILKMIEEIVPVSTSAFKETLVDC